MKVFFQVVFSALVVLVFAGMVFAGAANKNLPSDAKCFVSADGLIISGDEFGAPLYVGDSQKLFQVVRLKKDYGNDKVVVSFHNPHNKKDGAITFRKGDTVVMGGTPYSLGRCPSVEKIVSIRKAEYLFAFPDGSLIYISGQLDELYNYRVYIGTGREMREAQITGSNGQRRIVRYRDGGTTFVSTDAGFLFVHRWGEARWKNISQGPFEVPPSSEDYEKSVVLQRLDPSRFTIREVDGVVTIVGDDR